MKRHTREHGPRRRPEPRADAHREAGRQHTPASNLIYGVLPVLEALRGDRRSVERVLIAEGAKEHRLSDIVALCRSNDIHFARVPADVLRRETGPDVNHQGVVAMVSAADYASTDQILDGAGVPPLIIILDGVEDPRNLGAILRVADGAGADGVVIPERRAVGLTDTVAKTAAGALEFVKVAKTPNLNRFIDELKDRGIWVVGTADKAEQDYTEWDWTQPSALVLGSEGSGLHRLVAEKCDVLVKIPMYGRIDSLNVSVAAGVILFEARRQRGTKG